MSTTAIVSACYGGYDDIAPAPDGFDDCVLVTDQPDAAPEGWRVVHEHRAHVHPRLAAKVPKARPDLYTAAAVIVWADTNLTVLPGIHAWVAEPGHDALVASRHAWLSTVAEEAAFAEANEAPKYAGSDLAKQAESYASQQPYAPVHLWSGLMAARRRVWPMFGDAWLAEMVRWSVEDQISLPIVLARAGVAVEGRPPIGRGSDVVAWRPHRL